MTERTKIEWTDSTFSSWIGCTKVSPACDHCYAERQDARGIFGGLHWGPGVPRKRTSAANWRKPWQWHKNAHRFTECGDCGWRGKQSAAPFVCAACGGDRLKVVRRRVFCASLADAFDNEVPVQWRIELIRLIVETPNLDWLLLTKRIGNATAMLEQAFRAVHHQREGWADNVPPNVWLGATICNQQEAARDVPKLLAVPAAVRFLSIEPMLGPIDLINMTTADGLAYNALSEWMTLGADPLERRVDWIIAGGESGPKARPMHPDWARSLRDQCAAASVPFLFKQWGEFAPSAEMHRAGVIAGHQLHSFPWGRCGPQMAHVGKKLAGRLLDGIEHNGYPKAATKTMAP